VGVVSVGVSVVPEVLIQHDLVGLAQGPGRRSQGAGLAHIHLCLLVVAPLAPAAGRGAPALTEITGPVARLQRATKTTTKMTKILSQILAIMY